MIVVKIELHSARDGHVEELGRMLITNDGTGTATRGNYNVKVGRKGAATSRDVWESPLHMGHVANYPRKSYTVWKLILRALEGIYK